MSPFSSSKEQQITQQTRQTNANTAVNKVIEYLVKKGYNRTEQMLRQESANLDKDGRPIPDRAEDFGNGKYSRAFRLLTNWIDQNLDIYKVISKEPYTTVPANTTHSTN